MKQKLLLLKDVEDLGRIGDIVEVRPGYARNFLIPTQKAVRATKGTINLKKKLEKIRKERAVLEKKESEELAKKLAGITLIKEVKVDVDEKMYGSVSVVDIKSLLEKENIELEKKNILLRKPIKTLGEHEISFLLKEGIKASCKLKVIKEGSLGEKE